MIGAQKEREPSGSASRSGSGSGSGSGTGLNGDDAVRCCVELREGLSVERLVECLKTADGMRELGSRALAFYLWDMQERGLHLSFGYANASHFAEERLGIGSRRRARGLSQVARELRSLQGVDRALARGELS